MSSGQAGRAPNDDLFTPTSPRRARGPRRPVIWIALALLGLGGLVSAGPASARRPHAARHHKHAHPAAKLKKRSHDRALVTTGGQPEPSIFGLSTAVYDSSHSNFVAGVPAAHQLGARWDHFTAGVETASGQYQALDWEVKQARQYGMGVVLTMGGIPSACSLHPRPGNIHACPPTSSADLLAYEAYFRNFLIHYRNVVQYYESWTEPNNSSSWVPGPQPAAYVRLLEAEYSVMQSVNAEYGVHLQLLFASPTGFSVAPGTTGWQAVLPYTEEVLDALDGAKPFDAVALHAYRFPPGGYGPSVPAFDYVGGVPAARGAAGPFPQFGCNASPWCQMTWPEELSAYEQEFANHGYGDPALWITEFGWPGNAQPEGAYFPSETEQAQDLEDAYQDLLQLPFVKSAMWFNVRDYQPGYASPDPSFFYHYGLLEYDFGQKPAAVVFQELASAYPGR